MKIRHLLANVLSMPIQNKEKRHFFRKIVSSFYLKDVLSFFKFVKSKKSENSILLVETNSSHGEVIIGYVRYFVDLGYQVDILINTDILRENPFCRLNLDNVRIFNSNYAMMCFFLKLKQLIKYKHVFLMTSAGYYTKTSKGYDTVFSFYKDIKKHPSLIVVEHDLNDVERFDEEDLLKKNRLLTLGHFSQGVFASPIRFGSLKITPKNDITTFITVGAINSVRKNHQILMDSIKSLAQQNLKFKVLVVGLGALENLPIEVQPYIEILGRLDFPKMFEAVENADFFLPLLDPNSKEHERYITTGVTGSAQLIYAFKKVPVIHPKFAEFYCYDTNNAIVTEDLADGMKCAINMNQSEYQQKQNALSDLAKSLEAETYENLLKVLR